MPNLLRLPSNFVARVNAWLSGHFATPQSRFRLAVSTGFLIVAVGFLTIGTEERFGVAQSVLGFFGLPDGALQQPVAYSSAPSGERVVRHRLSQAHAKRHVNPDLNDVVDKPVALTRKSVCVRLCDGFAFPVGDYHGEGDRAAHEAACRSECPGANTALYVLPQGSDSLADATEVRTGHNYSKMSDAFRYTTFVDEACTCHPQGGAKPSLLHDFTLRRGDAVMTSTGLQVFHGGAGYPFKPRDFVALKKSRDIRRADLKSLKAIEQARLVSSTNVASAPPKAKPAAISRNGTKGLEHQAKN